MYNNIKNMIKNKIFSYTKIKDKKEIMSKLYSIILFVLNLLKKRNIKRGINEFIKLNEIKKNIIFFKEKSIKQ